MTPVEPLLAPVDWRDLAVEVEGRHWAYRAAGDGEIVLLLDPPGPGGSGGGPGPLEQLADRYRLIETTFVADDGAGGAVEAPARRAARLVRQLAETLGLDRFAVISRGAATSVALWLAIEDPAAVTTLVLESPPPPDAEAAFPPDAALLNAMPSLEVPTLVLLGEGVEPGLREQLSIFKRLLPASTVGLVYGAGGDVRDERPSAYLSAVTEYLERGQAFVVSNRSTVIHA